MVSFSHMQPPYLRWQSACNISQLRIEPKNYAWPCVPYAAEFLRSSRLPLASLPPDVPMPKSLRGDKGDECAQCCSMAWHCRADLQSWAPNFCSSGFSRHTSSLSLTLSQAPAWADVCEGPYPLGMQIFALTWLSQRRSKANISTCID